ncbi:ssDNA-binding protein, mitochondrial [Neurospora sp. IMI 360204]|nr:ssDNA-binding protein, mitochondrial [Neurospora sp. IMI 360204]
MSAFLRPVFGAAARPAVRSFSSTSARGLARVQIIGNLADTPEVRATSTGREMIKYAIASNSGPRSTPLTSWFNVTSFAEGKARDFLLTLPKGTTVFVEGELSLRNWSDEEGRNRTSVNIVHRSLEVLRRPYTGPRETTETEAETEGETQEQQ